MFLSPVCDVATKFSQPNNEPPRHHCAEDEDPTTRVELLTSRPILVSLSCLLVAPVTNIGVADAMD